MSDGSIRFVKYVSFFTKDDKMFNRIHYILNKEFQDKTEYIHTKEDQKQITGVLFRYQILAKNINSVNEDTKSETGVTLKSNLPSTNKSSSFASGAKREYHTINLKRTNEHNLINPSILNIVNFIVGLLSVSFIFLFFFDLLSCNSLTQPIDPTYGTTFLASLPFNVHSEEYLEINGHTIAEHDDYSDEEYPSPTPIQPSSGSTNELELDEEVSPEVVQAISDEIEADINEYIERDIEMLQEELGDNVELRVVVIYDDEDDSSNDSDSDSNMLCDISYVYVFDADLDLDLNELTDFLYFFM
jgi:hypothetical protein